MSMVQPAQAGRTRGRHLPHVRQVSRHRPGISEGLCVMLVSLRRLYVQPRLISLKPLESSRNPEFSLENVGLRSRLGTVGDVSFLDLT